KTLVYHKNLAGCLLDGMNGDPFDGAHTNICIPGNIDHHHTAGVASRYARVCIVVVDRHNRVSCSRIRKCRRFENDQGPKGTATPGTKEKQGPNHHEPQKPLHSHSVEKGSSAGNGYCSGRTAGRGNWSCIEPDKGIAFTHPTGGDPDE